MIAATVIAERASDANALATTLNVLPVEDGLRLAASISDAECLILTADGQAHKSPGWARYERPLPSPKADAGGPAVRPAEPSRLLRRRIATRPAPPPSCDGCTSICRCSA